MVSALGTLVSSTFAIALGITYDSLALIVFGAVAVLADMVLVVHLGLEQQGRNAMHLERVVLRIVAAGLVCVGVAAAWFGANHLV